MARVLVLVALGGCLLEPDPPLPSKSAVRRLAAGDAHACWIDDAMELRCWGYDGDDELGDGGATGELSALPLSLGKSWTAVSAYRGQTCGVHDGTVECWGSIQGTVVPTPQPIGLSPQVFVTRLEVGDLGSCAFDAAGAAYCWGSSMIGLSSSPSLLTVAGHSGPWLTVQMRNDHACALDTDDQLWCWGDNTRQQFGTAAPSAPVSSDMAVKLPASYLALALDVDSSCAINTDHRLVCWGNGEFDGAQSEAGVVDDRAWTAVALMGNHACGIAEGTVSCFGQDESGALGDGFAYHYEPHQVMNVANPTAIVVGVDFTCASSGTAVLCWGASQFGQLGNGEVAKSLSKQHVDFGVVGLPTSITTAADHSCVLINNEPYCWGRNQANQTALPGPPVVPTPSLAVSMTGPLTKIATGLTHTCVDDGGTGLCWGMSNAKDTGFGSSILAVGEASTCHSDGIHTYCVGVVPWTGDDTAATETASPNVNPVALAVGDGLVVVIGTGGKVYSAGTVCGPRSATLVQSAATFMTPSAVAVASYVVSEGLPSGHACIADTTTLRCFGQNDSNQVSPTPGCVSADSPTTVVEPASAGWASTPGSVSLATRHSYAINSAGKLDCWGANERGELGAMPAVITAPKLCDPDGGWTEISTSVHHSCGIENGQVYCWGINMYGELGVEPHFHDTPVAVTLP